MTSRVPNYRAKWGMVYLTVVVGLALLVLSWWRLGQTRVNFAIETGAFSASIAKPAELPPFGVKSISIKGALEFSDGHGPKESSAFLTLTALEKTGFISADRQSITLQKLDLKEGTQISLRAVEGRLGHFELTLTMPDGVPAEATVFVQGAASLVAEKGRRDVLANPIATIEASGKRGPLVLEFELQETLWSLRHPLSISQLGFRDTSADGGESPFSAIIFGKADFIETKGTVELRPRQQVDLVLPPMAENHLTSVRLSGSKIEVDAECEVSSISTSWTDQTNTFNRMPSALARLAAYEYVPGLASYLLAVLGALLPLLFTGGPRS